ncbi:hypothetical protein [Streptomyces albidochromogenes]|uniref:hypothetical protein n=1 Tax=Streptomyces albidochromogenes TaxID=329524 RepID=UPI00142F27A3|nr:hypothetical protein [Streptomyces albidochromogenes]
MINSVDLLGGERGASSSRRDAYGLGPQRQTVVRRRTGNHLVFEEVQTNRSGTYSTA